MGCGVRPSWIWLVSTNPADSQVNWDLVSLEVGSTPWALCHAASAVPEQLYCVLRRNVLLGDVAAIRVWQVVCVKVKSVFPQKNCIVTRWLNSPVNGLDVVADQCILNISLINIEINAHSALILTENCCKYSLSCWKPFKQIDNENFFWPYMVY